MKRPMRSTVSGPILVRPSTAAPTKFERPNSPPFRSDDLSERDADPPFAEQPPSASKKRRQV
jgi:hypothetical protein